MPGAGAGSVGAAGHDGEASFRLRSSFWQGDGGWKWKGEVALAGMG